MHPRDAALDLYVIAIGGTGTAPLACLLQALGHRVRGADGPLYPPMSDLLAAAGIAPHVGYDARHLTPAPDLVVVGNAVPRTNPEVVRVEAEGLDRISMPQALSRFLLADRKPLVVAGTHGKTTTTAMASWVLREAGREPGFLIGGVPCGMDRSFEVGTGDRFVIEGDEYNAAYFDRGPKFLHYRPHTLILTSVEYDHADLYPSHDHLLAAYRELVALVPADGLVAACGDAPGIEAVLEAARAPVCRYGFGPANDVRVRGGADGVQEGPDGSHLVVETAEGTWPLTMAVPGRHNVQNALGVWSALGADRVDPALRAEALGRFSGVKRRLEVLGTADGVTVVDDFAHHPTAVGASLSALRHRFAGRRVLALFEPRSLTAGRAFLHEAYREAFSGADGVRLAPIFHHARLDDADRLDVERLVHELIGRDVDAARAESIDQVLASALAWLRPGDVVVTMSSGAFEGMPRALLGALSARAG